MNRDGPSRQMKSIVMKNPFLFWFIPLLFLTAAVTFGFTTQKSLNTMLDYSNDPYEELWAEVDSLEGQGLLRSALERVDLILERARTEEAAGQLLKGLTYRARFRAELNEDGFELIIKELEKELEEATFPVQPVLHSVLGQLYQQYVQYNQFRLPDRTELALPDPKADLQTWTAGQLQTAAAHHYLKSLEEKEPLRSTAVEVLDPILTNEPLEVNLRPSLYDLLAHRVIDHFSNSRNTISAPLNAFFLDDPAAFAPAAEFASHGFSARDTNNYTYRALLVYQDLLSFRMEAGFPAAQLHADLQRLDFVRNESVLPEKDSLYRKALEELQDTYEGDPGLASVNYRLARLLTSRGSQYDPQARKDLQWELKKAVGLCEETLEDFPGTAGAVDCAQLLRGLKMKRVNVSIEDHNLPERPLLASVAYKNVPELHFFLFKLSTEEIEQAERLRWDSLKTFYQKKEVLRTWSVSLPQEEDYQEHRTEFAISPLPLGQYALVASFSEEMQYPDRQVPVTYFSVTNLAYLSRNEGGNTRLAVVNRQSGHPLKGVKAAFFANEYDPRKNTYFKGELGQATSDEKGFLVSPLEGRNFFVQLTHGADTLLPSQSFYNYSYSEKAQVNQRVVFFLDRAIYRPGQTIYFKGLALERGPDGLSKILEDQEVLLTLRDVNGQEVSSQTFQTNEYGTFNGSFIAPESGLLGQMSLLADLGTSRQVFRVEEYKRPKFEVLIDPLEGAYELGEEITINGKAMAFAGYGLDGASVTYRVVRETRFPWFPWLRFGGWPQAGESQEIAIGTFQTEADGRFSFPFVAQPDRSIPEAQKPEFQYTVYVSVTDLNGETQSGQSRVNLGYIRLRANVRIPEQIDRSEGTTTISISTTNLDGQPLGVDGQVKIIELESPPQPYIQRYWPRPDTQMLTKAEFQRLFPEYAYQNEDLPAKWPHKATVFEKSINTADTTTLSVPLTDQWAVGHYLLLFETRDAAGEAVEVRQYCQLFDREKKAIPADQTARLRAPQQPLEPGSEAQVDLAASSDDLQVLFELERQGELLQQEWMKVDHWTERTIPITEADRGNILVHLTYVRNNRVKVERHLLQVPWTNKQLQISYESFRDKLRPGQEEQWKVRISGPEGERVAAEMVATLYDASLDEFAPHQWGLNIYPTYGYSRLGWNPHTFSYSGLQAQIYPEITVNGPGHPLFRELSLFGGYGRVGYMQKSMQYRSANVPVMAEAMESNAMMDSAAGVPPPPSVQKVEETEEYTWGGGDPELDAVQVRTNLDETVFFLPDLKTDENGDVLIEFTMNEALTRWKFMALAHTKDLKTGLTQNETVTQKELMVQPNAPRFIREGDQIVYSAKVTNLTEESLSGTARLELIDPLSEQPVDLLFDHHQRDQRFTVEGGRSISLRWTLKVPKGELGLLKHRLLAQAGDFSDGEASMLPILTNRMLVTETLPMNVRGGQTKTFTLEEVDRILRSGTADPERFSLEFTSNPAWFAVKALPYLMEYPHECAEQIFSRYYANALAQSVSDQHPKIQEVFEEWKGTDALASNLSTNQALKNVLLEETPWVLDAQSEAEQRERIALLFDLDRMASEKNNALVKLEELQMASGGFGWFNGMRENRFITQYIVAGLGQLENLTATNDPRVREIVEKALPYLDRQIADDYEHLKELEAAGKIKMEEDHLGQIHLHYLYLRSFFPEIKLLEDAKEGHDYFTGQVKTYWPGRTNYQQGLAALALHRMEDKETPGRIVASLKERALQSEELGMYWKTDHGFFWYQRPLETHSLLMEVFNEIDKDPAALDEMRLWLLKHKQTNRWETTKATAQAVYALLNTSGGKKLLAETSFVDIRFPNLTPEAYAPQLEEAREEAEAGSMYFKTSWEGEAIQKGLGTLTVNNPNEMVSWGGLYWQYFEDLDQIQTFEKTPLTLRKQLFKKVNTEQGPELVAVKEGAALQVGNRLTVRLELRVDRDMEFVHLKDMRAAGLEPVNVLSQYKWQGGLGYYESTGDVATNFFFDYLPRGTYVFEYPLLVSHAGDFSNGISTIQCMYAPEFSSHSKGGRFQAGQDQDLEEEASKE